MSEGLTFSTIVGAKKNGPRLASETVPTRPVMPDESASKSSAPASSYETGAVSILGACFHRHDDAHTLRVGQQRKR